MRGNWPQATRGVRVLVECEDPSVQDGLQRALRDAGYAVAGCEGPAARSSGRCPLVDDGRCGLVADADVVVQAFDRQRADLADVLPAIRARVPQVPVVLERHPRTACDGSDEPAPPAGSVPGTVLHSAMTAPEVLVAVAAIATHDHPITATVDPA